MKRTVLVLMLLFTFTQVFAGGAQETSNQFVSSTSKQNVKESNSITRSFLIGVADIFDTITQAACYSLTPFPNVLPGVEDGSDMNLVPESYVKRMGNVKNMVSAVFVTLIIAEILWTAIYKCWLSGDMAVTKQVSLVFIKGMFLFFLVLSLPTIIEYTRMGFQNAAYIISGRTLTKAGTYDADAAKDSIFDLPGDIIRDSITIIEFMDPKQVGSAGIDLIQATEDSADWGTKTMVSFLTQIIYWIAQIVCVCCLSIASLHVMFNIIEVYLLLGIVCFLVPFSIFSLTKFLGERAILSLFMNLVELFIIMVIVYSCSYLIKSFNETMTSMFMGNAISETSWQVNLPNYFGNDSTDFDATIQMLEKYKALNKFKSHGDYESYVTGMTAAIDPNTRARQIETIRTSLSTDIRTALNTYIYDNLSKNTGVLRLDASDTEFVTVDDSTQAVLLDTNKLQKYQNRTSSNNDLFSALSVKSQMSFLESFMKDNPITNTLLTVGHVYMISTELVPLHLCMCLLSVMIQFYFLGQSGRIANGLMSGSVATDGFTGAHMKMAAGKTIGALFGAASMPSRLGAAGVKGVAVNNNALGKYENKHGIVPFIMRNMAR